MRKADNLPPSCAVVTKSGNINSLEPSGPVQACNGTALQDTHAGIIGRAIKALVCGRSPAEIVGSNTIEGMDVCLLCVMCFAR